VVGGGPAGATAAADLAAHHSVLLLDRAGRIKPCGGAIPPRLVQDFDIPEHLLVNHVKGARMVAPSGRAVDMAIEGGYVGMVDRDAFDEWLRARAVTRGARRATGTFVELRRAGGHVELRYRAPDGECTVRARRVIGADGAQSQVARQALPHIPAPAFVAAYHEIVQAPAAQPGYDHRRCDVYYQGDLSPDFYGWVFPHGDTVSIGVGSARKGFSLRGATTALRAKAGLTGAATVRREGAPIPVKPMKRRDDGHNVVLAGDASGVVAPASGEGIYYAMLGGRLAAEAVAESLARNDARCLALARQRFMRAHGRVFWVLGIMQWFWYGSDARRERFVSICRDPDVQHLTWQAYMHKELVRARPMAHVRIFFKDLAHLAGVVRP
jgi:geranylgeranyl reductase